MTQLTMRERRELLHHYLQELSSGITNYSISDWAVNHLLLELIKLGSKDQSVFEVVNNPSLPRLPLSVKLLESELEQSNVFTE
ncbi:MAG: hypothetical protein AB4038_20685 [Prochloraceae cyanobacterium]